MPLNSWLELPSTWAGPAPHKATERRRELNSEQPRRGHRAHRVADHVHLVLFKFVDHRLNVSCVRVAGVSPGICRSTGAAVASGIDDYNTPSRVA